MSSGGILLICGSTVGASLLTGSAVGADAGVDVGTGVATLFIVNESLAVTVFVPSAEL